MKKFLKKHRSKLVVALVAVVILGVAWKQGGGYFAASPALPAETSAEQLTDTVIPVSPVMPVNEAAGSADDAPEATLAPKIMETAAAPTETPAVVQMEITIEAPTAFTEPLSETPAAETPTDITTEKDKYLTDPVPEGKPEPVEPQEVTVGSATMTCTISVRCNTILDNLADLSPEKSELVPADGVIFPPTVVTFYEGESVFNVLLREMKRAKLHMEFVNTPIYNSAYIEGIGNLYEFDCGNLSGWMYSVNGWFPNYGCSRYVLQDGDLVEWLYTCDLGRDIGGFYATGGYEG